jgi:penicillin amidase
VPAIGWTGGDEWTGWVPFAELPHAFDPPEHFIVTANNKAAGGTYPHFITNDYPEPYRAQRITDLIRAHRPGTLTPDDFRNIQADTTSLHARALLPVLLQHLRAAPDDAGPALALLRTWNHDASPSSAAAAIFQAWFLELAPALVGDELGPLAMDAYGARFSAITRLVLSTLAKPDSPWCDDVRTPASETCDDAVGKALGAAMATLRTRLGLDMTGWRWDTLHHAVFPHQGLDTVAVLRPLLSRSLPSAGDWSTVNAGPVAWDHPYEQRAVPGYRQIVDLSPANDSRFLDAVGQSGHFLSPHYGDFLSDWTAVRHRSMRMERAAVDRGALGTLRLAPR